MEYEKEKKKSNGSGAGGEGIRGIVNVEPKPSKGFTSKVIDLLENLVVKFLYDSSLPHHYLSGNFAPVPDETPPTEDLPVTGYLPVSTIGSDATHFRTCLLCFICWSVMGVCNSLEVEIPDEERIGI